jgi:hypothetical protein
MIDFTSDFKDIRIYIDEVLHIQFERKNFIGIQTWIEGRKNRNFFIEIYTKYKAIKLEYDKEEIWKTILDILDKNI